MYILVWYIFVEIFFREPYLPSDERLQLLYDNHHTAIPVRKLMVVVVVVVMMAAAGGAADARRW